MIKQQTQIYELVCRTRKIINKSGEIEWVLRNYVENLNVRTPIKQVYYGDDYAIHYGKGVNNIRANFMKKTESVNTYIPILNDYQYFLYLRAIYGLRIYKKKELDRMSKWEKGVIDKVHKRCRIVLDAYLERALIVMSNRIIKQTGCNKGRFFRSRENQYTPECWDQKEEFVFELGFKELGVTRKMIAWELVDKQVLPGNFFELKNRKVNEYRTEELIDNL